MVDWQGLLKFSLKYTDGTKSSNFQEMPAEDKKWLQEAMAQYCNSQVQRIKQLLQKLRGFTELQQENVFVILEQLQELLDSLDRGSTLYKLQGHVTLLKIIFYSKSSRCRVVALQIYSSVNQNDSYVQNISINTGALEMIELLKKEQDKTVRQNLLGAISATIRGENLQAKRIFIRIKGLDLLADLQQSKDCTPRLSHKAFILWRDLLFYDDHLHKTYNDLSNFNNTTNLKLQEIQQSDKKHDLTYDINKQFRSKNELPENAVFKGAVKKALESRSKLFQSYLSWLKVQIQQQSS